MTKDNRLKDNKLIDDEMIDNLLKGYQKPEDLIGENGLLKQLTKRLLERAMAAEMTEHVGYERHEAAGRSSGNSRNGKSAKTIKGTFGTMPITANTPKGTVLISRQMSDWDQGCSLGHFLTGGDLVNGMNNVRAVIAVSTHITDANCHIL